MAKNVQRAEQILKKSVQRAEQMEHKKGEHHMGFTLVMFAFGAFYSFILRVIEVSSLSRDIICSEGFISQQSYTLLLRSQL